MSIHARIFAIADLHLGSDANRTMDKFGDIWINHPEKIAENARRLVGTDDILLLPGDLSWAKRRSQAMEDLAYIAALPGFKVCIKGNHDFWWESDKPIAYPGLSNPPLIFEDDNGRVIGIAGTRGWNAPQPGEPKALHDEALIGRERERLNRMLDRIRSCPLKIAMLHYPPHPFISDLRDAGVQAVVYGHVHANSLPADEILALNGDSLEGIRCYCVACDRIDMTPLEIPLQG